MDLNRIFAVALKHYRERAGMSQEEMAATSGLDRTYISQLERELKSPTLTTLQKLSACLGLEAHRLLREPFDARGPRVPGDYMVSDRDCLFISREGGTVEVPASVVTSAINVAHELIDSMYAIDLDIAAVLGMRNLSAFIGELYAAAVVKTSAGRFRSNPHQDGYPDLLLMDEAGRKAWQDLEGRTGEKGPFSPFPAGGVEVKATCGGVPTPQICRRRGIERPDIGKTRIGCMTNGSVKIMPRFCRNPKGCDRRTLFFRKLARDPTSKKTGPRTTC
jgi:transcriptional regulator with XRE-family HTH domain